MNYCECGKKIDRRAKSCKRCSKLRDKNPNWKGRDNYRMVGHTRRIYEHRMLIEQALGRELFDREASHHLDFCKGNNEISNLSVIDVGRHQSFHCRIRRDIIRMIDIDQYSLIQFSRGGVPIIPTDYPFFKEHFIIKALQRRGLKCTKAATARMWYMTSMIKEEK